MQFLSQVSILDYVVKVINMKDVKVFGNSTAYHAVFWTDCHSALLHNYF